MKKIFIGGMAACSVHNEKNFLKKINYKDQWEIVSDYKDADVIVITDSCVGSNRTFSYTIAYLKNLLKEKKPGAKLILSGCLANGSKYNLSDEIKNVLSQFNIVPSKDIVSYVLKMVYPEIEDLDGLIPYTIGYRKLKVSVTSGCQNNCAFCKKNYMNFPLQSYPLETIEKFVKETSERCASRNPIRYVINNSSNLSLYGVDLYGTPKAHDIIKILTEPSSVKYAEMGALINWYPELVKEIIRNPKIKQIFTSIESGSERIYDMMNRPISLERLKEIIKLIARERPDITIRSEMIAGFPTETVEDIKRTIDLFYELDIYPAYIWPYINSEYIQSNHYEQHSEDYISNVTRYAKEKLAPLQEQGKRKEMSEALITERFDDKQLYGIIYPNGKSKMIGYHQLDDRHNLGDIISSSEIKPKTLIKRNKNK